VTLKNLATAPFPWFGGKSQAADVVWAALGDVDHYVEPFAGSLAVLLNRPHPCNRPYYSETVNDLDGFVVNAWRSIQLSPEATAAAASWPVSEADKTARQIACLKWRTERHLELLAGDAGWHDPLIGGWWLWSVCVQIGAFDGRGPWTADQESGRIIKQGRGAREPGVSRGRPNVGNDGRGVNRPDTREPGVKRDLPHVSNNGQGVNRPDTREPGVGVDPEFHPVTMPELLRWFGWLSARLRHVRILNGSWERTVTSGASKTLPVRQGGVCGVFLDPPYDTAERSAALYAHESDGDSIPAAVRAWCARSGDDPQYRIVLAGYDVEHVALERHGWRCVEWFKAGYLAGGMGNVAKGRGTGDTQQHRERLWLSPHCLADVEQEPDAQMALWS
jgi:hypothetical protein